MRKFLVFVLSVFWLGEMLIAQASAQAPAPPQAPQNAPSAIQQQRRERLQNLGGQVFNLLGAAGGGQPAAGQPGVGQSLDFGRVNGVIPSLLGQLARGDAAIESWGLFFDPNNSDLGQDRLAVVTDLALRRTAWSAEASRLHVEIRASA